MRPPPPRTPRRSARPPPAAHRTPHGVTQTVRGEPARGQADARARHLDAPGHLGLVAAEGDGHHGHAGGQGPLGDPHAGVAHQARGTGEQGAVGDEPLDPHVRRAREPRGIDGRRRDHHVVGLVRECGDGHLGEQAVALERRGAGHHHQRAFQPVQPRGRRRGRLPQPGPHEPDLRGPVGARVLEGLGGEDQHQRRGQVDVGHRADRPQAHAGAQSADVVRDDAHQEPQHEALCRAVTDAAAQVGARGQPEPERRRVAGRERWRGGQAEGPWEPGPLSGGRGAP